MRKFLILLLILIIIGCEKDGAPKASIFEADKLPQLLRYDVGSFWDCDSIENILKDMGAIFEDHYGFINGVRYAGSKNIICVSVFKTRADAIEAMELRRNSVAVMIVEGGQHELINEKWVYGIPKTAFSVGCVRGKRTAHIYQFDQSGIDINMFYSVVEQLGKKL